MAGQDHAPGARSSGGRTATVGSLPARIVERAHVVDEAVEQWLEPRRNPTLDAVFYGLSSAADHGLLWHAVGAARAAARGTPAGAVKFSAVLGLESAITNGAVKSLFRRVRPREHFEHSEPLPYQMRRPITSSFPSGHAATAFMCASVLAHGTRRAPVWYSLAALIAASRVYVRMHHASDAVVGAALGLGLGRLARHVLD